LSFEFCIYKALSRSEQLSTGFQLITEYSSTLLHLPIRP